eukprot:CAMPEP_0197537256 /NCGR_PEP_ID=MMETSP1318-20131121/56302_1 /TAXON_ID=552666 /ORGANISM="Partenskyella glossopodia, Strain RCC365" /LENGTH=385 /DNA_ID=CAMNT_0043095385 /DNA_START=40 /DNA_END=1194 /DNA_ORIENTATION=-
MASIIRSGSAAARVWAAWMRSALRPKDAVAASVYESEQHLESVEREFQDLDSIRPMPKFTKAMKLYRNQVRDAQFQNMESLQLLLSPTEQPRGTIFGWKEEDEFAEKNFITRVNYFGSHLGGTYGSNDNLLSHLSKDWSDIRPKQWDTLHEKIISTIKTSLISSSDSPLQSGEPISIVVPGCGLGRLVYDIGESLKSDSELNQMSVYIHGTEASTACLKIIDSLFNAHTQEFNEFSIHPFATQRKNNLSPSSRLAYAKGPLPNPKPQSEGLGGRSGVDYSFSAMTLDELKQLEETTDCVVTCFFLDCTDAVETIKDIFDCLRPGGVWINCGPLAYHDWGLSPTSKELALAVEESGFELLDNGIHQLEEDLPYFERPDSTLVEQTW